MNVPQKAGGLRFLRAVVLGQMLGIAVLAVLIAVAFALNADRVDQINQERSQNVRRNCDDVNKRHDAAITALDTILARAQQRASTPEERARIRQSRDTTVLLISALTPKRDCAELAHEQVQER